MQRRSTGCRFRWGWTKMVAMRERVRPRGGPPTPPPSCAHTWALTFTIIAVMRSRSVNVINDLASARGLWAGLCRAGDSLGGCKAASFQSGEHTRRLPVHTTIASSATPTANLTTPASAVSNSLVAHMNAQKTVCAVRKLLNAVSPVQTRSLPRQLAVLQARGCVLLVLSGCRLGLYRL